MSVHLSSLVWRMKGFASASEKLVLLKLADNASDEGYCWPSCATVARDCALSVRQVRRVIATFEARGWLSREPRFRNGLQTTNGLLLSVDELARCAAGDAPEGAGEAPGEADTHVRPRADTHVRPGRTPMSALGRTPMSGREPSYEPSKNRARAAPPERGRAVRRGEPPSGQAVATSDRSRRCDVETAQRIMREVFADGSGCPGGRAGKAPCALEPQGEAAQT